MHAIAMHSCPAAIKNPCTDRILVRGDVFMVTRAGKGRRVDRPDPVATFPIIANTAGLFRGCVDRPIMLLSRQGRL